MSSEADDGGGDPAMDALLEALARGETVELEKICAEAGGDAVKVKERLEAFMGLAGGGGMGARDEAQETGGGTGS